MSLFTAQTWTAIDPRKLGLTAIFVLLAVLLCRLFLLAAISSEETVQGIEIFEHGIYSVKTLATAAAPGSVNATRDRVGNIQLLETTTTIPARIGVEFGFRYRIFGEPSGATALLKEVTLVPEPGIQNPKTRNTMTRGEAVLREEIGSTYYKGYGFDDPWEVVLGTWTFELWQGDRKLASQSFEVLKP